MKLPRHVLLRIRRAIRRQIMRPLFSDLLAADEAAQMQGHRPPPNPIDPMKFVRFLGLLLMALVAIVFLLAFTGCTTVTTTAPDGTVTSIKAPSPGVLPFAAAAITAYSPRPIIVREEKSVRITREEIDKRWRPALP